jgi:radical SAM superfamily enzyme YgiQ (UPF0313 family)
LNLINRIKKNKKNSKIIAAGYFASLFSKQILLDYPVDVVAKADPEFTVPKIIPSLLKNKPLSNFYNIAYKDNSRIYETPIKLTNNLDSLPFISEYFYRYRLPKFALITMRGCPFKCNFCDRKNLWGRKLRCRSPKNIVDEIEIIYKKFKPSEIKFEDENFTLFRNRTLMICKEIIKRKIKIPWTCTTRADCVDWKLLKLMGFAGCKTIYFGIESGSDKILKNLKKGIKASKIKKSIKLTKLAGINVGICIMTGCPGETQKTIDETLKLIYNLSPFEGLTINNFTILPGSELYRDFSKKATISNDYWLKNESKIFYNRKSFVYFHILKKKVKSLLNNFRIVKQEKYTSIYEL